MESSSRFRIQVIIDNETWDLVELPVQQKAIGCKCIFKVKHASDGTVDRFKARLVAKSMGLIMLKHLHQ